LPRQSVLEARLHPILQSKENLEAFDIGLEVDEARLASDVLEKEVFVHFESLGDYDIFSPKHRPEKWKRETKAQLDKLVDVTDEIWKYLGWIASTPISTLRIPFVDTEEKQTALLNAMNANLDKDFLWRYIRAKWPVFVEQRRRRRWNERRTVSQEEAERRS